MKMKNLKSVALALSVFMLFGTVTGCGPKNNNDPNESTSETAKVLEETTIQDTYTGIDDVYVLKDSKDVDYLNDVFYDSSIVKDITVDSSEVDLTKEGTYKIIYEITVDIAAFNKYKGSSIDESSDNKTLITKETTVVDKDKAQDLADKDTVVKADKDETVKKSDGTEVKTEEKAPASTTVTNGAVINASNKEEVKPEATAKPTEEPKKEETKKEESKPAASTEKKEETKTPASSNSSNKNDNNSSNNTSKPSSSSNNNSSNNNSSNNNSSNNNQPSKPAHTHTWVDVTKTVNHPAVTHEEPVYETKQVLVTPAWDERVYVKTVDICACGFETSDGSAMNDHLLETGHSCSFKDIYETVHHDAVYKEEQVQIGTKTVVDKAAWTETVVTGQKCSGCGATK